MFCPKCGHQFPDGTKFCPHCGHAVGERQRNVLALEEPSPSPTAQHAPVQEYQAPPQAHSIQRSRPQQGAMQGGPTQSSPKQRSKLIPIIIGVVALAVLVGGGFFVYKTFFDHTGKFVEPSLSEESPNRVSPKESIEVADIKLTTDQLNRYVITGTVRNSSDQTYDVKLDLTATKHSSDKYGEEVTETTSSLGLTSVSPYTRASGGSVTLYDLEPGERTFTLYTGWDSIESFLGEDANETDCVVSSVTLSDAQARTRFDHNINANGGIKDIQMTYTQDGKLRGSFVNDTGLYLNEVAITYVAKNKDGDPAVYGNGARPYGAKVDSLTVSTLKPGDTGEFEVYVGEGYDTIDPLDVQITPDPNKSTFN